MKELIDLIDKLRITTELHGSVLLQIHISILFARFKAIDGEYHITNHILELATKLARDNNLPNQVNEINKVRDEIYEEMRKYGDSKLNFKEIQTKLAQLNVESYLNEILTSVRSISN